MNRRTLSQAVQSTPEEERRLVDQVVQSIRGEYKEKMRAAMLAKLAENRHKTHWREAEIDFLITELHTEVDELEHALRRGDPEIIIWKEAADVANLAAMAADRGTQSIDECLDSP